MYHFFEDFTSGYVYCSRQYGWTMRKYRGEIWLGNVRIKSAPVKAGQKVVPVGRDNRLMVKCVKAPYRRGPGITHDIDWAKQFNGTPE